MSLRRIRRAAREERHELTAHAVEQMDEDNLTEADVREVLLRGRVVRELTNDPRGHTLRGSEQATRPRRRGRGGMPIPPIAALACRHGVRHGEMMPDRSDPCEYCSEPVDEVERLVTVYRHRNGKHFIFERVSARVCSVCGERYFSAATVRQMDRLMKTGRNRQSTVPVPIIPLRAAG